MRTIKLVYCFMALLFLGGYSAFSQNPIIRDQFTADPSARVFNGKVFVFPSHDIQAPEGKGLREDWFCMEDYHVFSSENLTDWTDHGVIVSQYDADWVDSTSYSMWAPDCIERNGKYYFYYPANTNIVGPNGRKGFGIGVAVADKPEGPYEVQDKPINGIHGIDPNILIDNDGQAYIYWSMGQIFVAKLKENMLELASEPQVIDNLPTEGLKEGPWVFERNGIYYLTFPHVENNTERLEYAMGKSPMGPFKMEGVIMDESPTGCWTNHHSVIEYNDQWYLFYHHNDLSPDFDKNRSVRIDSLFFNPDGTIQKVKPTIRGVGLADAKSKIEFDRYIHIGENTEVEFIDPDHTFKGWKTVFKNEGAWIRYNAVDFSTRKLKNVQLRVQSDSGGTIQLILRGDKVLSEVVIPSSREWTVVESDIEKYKKGTYDIKVELLSGDNVEIDWIRFK